MATWDWPPAPEHPGVKRSSTLVVLLSVVAALSVSSRRIVNAACDRHFTLSKASRGLSTFRHRQAGHARSSQNHICLVHGGPIHGEHLDPTHSPGPCHRLSSVLPGTTNRGPTPGKPMSSAAVASLARQCTFVHATSPHLPSLTSLMSRAGGPPGRCPGGAAPSSRIVAA
jgi:hypothetical protein